MTEYLTLKNENNDEFTVKHSRFIGYAKPVQTQEEAVAFINEIKSKHWDAKHNVYAYILRDGQTRRYSDDGEPQGTAGIPVLDVLQKEGLTDCCVVVTRYFGGILLGTGGLVRAYSGATKAGLLASKIITKIHGQKISVQTDYTGLGKIQYILGQRGLHILNSIYTDKVELEVLLPDAEIKGVMTEITEGTNGQAVMELQDECYFANIDGEMQIFED